MRKILVCAAILGFCAGPVLSQTTEELNSGGKNTMTASRARRLGVITTARSLENRWPATRGARACQRRIASITKMPSMTTSAQLIQIASSCQIDHEPRFTLDSPCSPLSLARMLVPT